MIKHIPIECWDEVKYPIHMKNNRISPDIVWVDRNGINTPFLVTVINKGGK